MMTTIHKLQNVLLNVLLSLFFLSGCQHKPSPVESMADFCQKLPRAQYANLKRIDYSSEWFEIYTVAPGVTAIYEPFQWQEAISYLIEGDKKALLFDSGNGIGDIAKVVRSLTNKPISVLNSHSHYDHVGGNYSFDNIYGLKTVFTIDRQKGHDNERISIEASSQALCKSLPIGVTEDNHIGRAYQISQFINDGHIFDLGNRKLQVIHTPGHTPDALILLDEKNELMFTGDSYYSGPIWLYAPETDLDQYQQSLAIMIQKSQNIKFLLPAHNTPLADPKLLVKALAGIKAVINGQAQSISQGEGMVEYIISDELPFSFLMRDEKLPYEKKD
jgi:glyoxylase-like metal-dependent hydrolase (beta-lactamase superfamily II)